MHRYRLMLAVNASSVYHILQMVAKQQAPENNSTVLGILCADFTKSIANLSQYAPLSS
jgi:hypothetical protein